MPDYSQDWRSGTGSEFGEVDNPAYGGYTEAGWDTGAWGDKISGWDTQGVALPNVPHGTLVELRNDQTGQTVTAPVVDKGPAPGMADIDMLGGTRASLGFSKNYKGPVSFRLVGGKTPALLPKSAEDFSASRVEEHPDSWMLPKSEEDFEPTPSLADSPEPSDEKPEPPKRERPVDTLRKNYPEYAKLSDEDLIPKLQAVFPDVPEDKLKVYGTQPGGGKLIKQYQDRGKNPLELFRKYYSEYADKDGNDDKDLEWMRSHFHPEMGPIQFKAFAKPPGPVLSALGHLYDSAGQMAGQMFRGAQESTVEAVNALGKPPGQMLRAATSPPAATPQNLGTAAALQDFYGHIDQMPKYLLNLGKAANVFGWETAAENWMTKNVAGFGGANNAFKAFVNNLATRGKQFEAQAAQTRALAPKDTGSQILETGGELLGSAPEVAVSFGLGSTGRAAALWGMLYEGVSGYGHAIENQQKNALLQGVSSAGFRQFAQYLLNTGKGRVVSGIANAFATVAETEIEKWARGEPNDITKDGKATTVGLLTGLLLGRGRAREAFLEAEPPQIGSVSPSSGFGDYAGSESILRTPPAEEVPRRTPQIDLPGQRWEESLRKTEVQQASDELEGMEPVPLKPGRKTVQEEFSKAFDAHQNGDHDTAAQYIDRGFSFMPDGEKRALAKDFIVKVDDLAGASQKQTIYPEDQIFNDYYFGGLPFGGIAKTIRDWFDNEKPGLSFFAPFIPTSPEEAGVEAGKAGAIVKSEEAYSRGGAAVGPAEIYYKAAAPNRPPTALEKLTGFRAGFKDPDLNLFEKITHLRFGDPMERLDRFFNNFSKQELVQQFLDYQRGAGAIKDPTARWIWQNVVGPMYDAIEKRDHAYGIGYDHRDNYFYQLLTHPARDLPRLQDSLARAGASLTFTKPREMRLVERLALGHEMITTNPIRLAQMRWWASERAIQKIRDIKQLEAQGLAFNTKLEDKNIPLNWKTNDSFITADKQSYYVHPDVLGVLKNKFDHGDIFRLAGVGPIFKFVAALKGTVAAKVSWSLFHPLHIMDIMQADTATNSLQRIMAGKGNWGDVGNQVLNLAPFVGSLPAGTRAYLKYADPVSYLQRRLRLQDLSADQQRDVKDFIDMGLVAETGQERQMQFTRWLQENGPAWIRKGGWPVKLGLDILGNPFGFNKWWFGIVTPRLKFAAAMMRRDTLKATRSELFRDVNRMDRLTEFQKFHRDIEGRYGEMHYDNLLWPRMLKQTGTTFMLSMGWQLGMFRTMGDGVVDLIRNAAHIQELSKLWQGRARDPQARQFVTNRMVFSALYMARGFAAGWAISYFLGGKKDLDPWDGVYPAIGKNPNGTWKRLNMQYFYKDVSAFGEYQRMTGSAAGAATQMAANKMQPMLMSVVQAMYNRDYMGHVIGDLPKRAMYLMHGFEPISFENAQQPGQTDSDRLLSFLGFNPSGRWTMRTDLGNRIIAQSVEQRNFGPMIDARDRYRQAFLAKDQAAIKAAHDELRGMDVTEKQIRSIQKDAKIPTEHKMFKSLKPPEQFKLLKTMSPQELKEYWPIASKTLHAKFHNHLSELESVTAYGRR